MPRLICLIPIRKGSKGVPDKNMKILGGKPLVAWVVDAITASHTAAEIWVATDDDRCRACLLLPVCAGGCPYARIIDMDKKTNKACPLNVTNLADYLWEHYLCKKSRKG